MRRAWSVIHERKIESSSRVRVEPEKSEPLEEAMRGIYRGNYHMDM